MFTIDDTISQIHCFIDGPISNSSIKKKLYETIEIKDFYSKYEFNNIIRKFISKFS